MNDVRATQEWFSIRPVDAWFFRDGKPFNRGQDQGDFRSLFPPAVPTLVGTMRYALALQNGWSGIGSWCDASNGHGQKLREALGNGPDDIAQMTFDGPIVEDEHGLLFPMPRHVLGSPDESAFRDELVRQDFKPSGWLVPTDVAVSSDLTKSTTLDTTGGAGTGCMLPLGPSNGGRSGDRKPLQQAENYFVRQAGLSRILAGTLPAANECLALNDLLEFEPRVGIGRDLHLRTVQKGQLFNPDFIRLRAGVGLAVGVGGVPAAWQRPSLIAFGGEARMAEVTPRGPFELGPAPAIEQGEAGGIANRVLILLSPAISASPPWYIAGPGAPAAQLNPTLNGRVITVALDRPQRIGGWDSLDGGPLPKHPCIPAGTVWWLDDDQLPIGTTLRIGGKQNHGFGLAVIGCMPAIWRQDN